MAETMIGTVVKVFPVEDALISGVECTVNIGDISASYRFKKGEYPVAIGDVFIYSTQAGKHACSHKSANFTSLPLGERPAIRACASSECVRTHVSSIFTKSVSEKTKPVRVVEMLIKASVEMGFSGPAAAAAFLSSIGFVYKCKRERDEVYGGASTSMMPPSRYGSKTHNAAPAYITRIASTKFKGVLTARQLELLVVTWNRQHTFRPLQLLGLATNEINAIVSNGFLSGNYRVARRGRCKCVGMDPPPAWCGFCGVPFSIDDQFALERLIEMIIKAPLAFTDIPIATALSIYHSEHGCAPNEDEYYAAVLSRRLKSLSEDTCEIADERAITLRPILECLYGVSFYERQSGEVCVYTAERAKYELVCAETIAEAIKGFPSLSEYRATKSAKVPSEKTSLTEEQEAAVSAVVSSSGAPESSIVVITGGPGVGKTRVIGEIANRLIKNKVPFRLASFTGKAVARIREQTKLNPLFSSTLDRLIVKRDVSGFEHLIIDETSMVTVGLFARFMDMRQRLLSKGVKGKPKTPIGLKITFVGDEDQLPPVGWGSLFSNMLHIVQNCGLPLFKLTHNFRIESPDASSASSAVILARAFDTIRSGGCLADVAKGGGDTFRVIDNAPGDGINDVVRVLKAKLISKEVLTPTDIGVIAPLNITVDVVNAAVRRVFEEAASVVKIIPPVTSKTRDGVSFSVRDRVIMTKNVYFPSCSASGVSALMPHRPPAVREKALKCGAPGGCPVVLYGAKECHHCVLREEAVTFGLGGTRDEEADGAGLAFMNGDTGTVVDLDDHGVYINFDAGTENVRFNWKRPSFRSEMVAKEEMPDLRNSDDDLMLTSAGTVGNDIPLGVDMLHVALLKPAFAITVHKSQGSEYKHVIVCLPRNVRGDFLNRAMFYTAVTRAQKSVTVITPGTFKSLQNIVDTRLRLRKGNLINRVADLIKTLKHAPDEGIVSGNSEDVCDAECEEPSYYDDDLCCFDDF